MRKKLFMTGMLSMVLAFGFVVIGCDNGSGGGGGEENTDPKKITITGLSGQSGTAQVVLLSSINETGMVAIGQGTISGSSVTVSLKKQDNTDWTGTGSYYMQLGIGESGYTYTNGKTLSELGISSEADIGKLPKINISETTTSVAFNTFAQTAD
jgi:hypothetical protein